MSKLIKDPQTLALDKTCELAENSAAIYASLAEMAVEAPIANKLTACAEARSQSANDLIVARQESGELPAAGKPEKAALQALGMKLHQAVDDIDGMYRSLRDMDLELKESADAARNNTLHRQVDEALQSLLLSVEEAARRLASPDLP